jgi:GAF domain-containing protein
LLSITYTVGLVVFWRTGMAGSGRLWLMLLPALAFILQGPRAGLLAGSLSVLTYIFLTFAVSQQLVPAGYEDPTAPEHWVSVRHWISEGGDFLLIVVGLSLILRSLNRDWLAALEEADGANKQLQAQAQELEATNKQLRRQASQLRTTAQIAHTGAVILDMEELLSEMVNTIQEGFDPTDVHYVGLFLLDEDQEFAVLRAASGEAGQLLLEMSHKLRLDETSAVGRSIIQRRAGIALSSGEGSRQSRHSLLSITRSEIALPLQCRGNTLGALTVQSATEAAFEETDVAVLQTLADQVAVAIDNVRLFSQTQAALEETQAVHRRYLARSWEEFLAAKPVTRVDYSRPEVSGRDEDLLRQARRDAMASGEVVVAGRSASGHPRKTNATLVIPLRLHGQVIGTMALQETQHRERWTAEEMSMAETIAEQVALTLEGLRLTEETQQRAARERLTSEIAARLYETLDLETVLKTAVREIGERLGLHDVAIQLSVEADQAS